MQKNANKFAIVYLGFAAFVGVVAETASDLFRGDPITFNGCLARTACVLLTMSVGLTTCVVVSKRSNSLVTFSCWLFGGITGGHVDFDPPPPFIGRAIFAVLSALVFGLGLGLMIRHRAPVSAHPPESDPPPPGPSNPAPTS